MPRRERNKFVKRGEIISITIEDYAFGGKGIGRIRNEEGEFVVFVPNTLPGQTVRAQINKTSKRYAEAKLFEVLSPSDQEVEVPFQTIPGAPYIKLPIDIQHQYKKDSTLELFKRIGKVANIEDLFDDFIASPEVFHYRNKMEYGFSAIRYDFEQKTDVDEFALGFKKRGTWWCAENLDKDSGLFDAQVEDGLKVIRQFCIDSGLEPWHAPQKKGFFRYFVVRKSYKTNQILCNLVTTSPQLSHFDMEGFVALLKELFGDRIAGLIHTTNDEIGDRTLAVTGNERLVFGENHIVENLLGLNFEISMKSFFQTNPKSAEKLYSKVIDYALEKADTVNGKIVMDLFCGTGTIGQILASKTTDAHIIGVDIVEDAIKDARKNALRNNITGVDFYAADVGKFLVEYPEYKGKIETIVLDPPRAGIAPKTLLKVIQLGASRMVYVSCNPATQARDTETLMQAGYKISKMSMVDQFPHTAHIESIVLFEK
ncbi:23S rRNA (uracil(1939)-C(5))-methyltransferase RlmD [Wenyingzhuangia sp. 2_MG-2023]|uniref:23S rRNA (uracil(1939)-C(5))-methyltransferase RlmD n=1 Tax=Wenyingzhuangia sp. 2_MG-2023 TaxID=3062639 RepID=UPI0026E14E72|nr:23S rRNA (uracil(1939)-C(5))-methyltransferase RlmD [Wenyingzhuangia sp. 2_MG-2023]MDO6737209.1 23S rRNA (uracil(1939)-C(5))-methyltransferase RlmD [Wenyingzhuangia sp. 2_MG-2023]